MLCSSFVLPAMSQGGVALGRRAPRAPHISADVRALHGLLRASLALPRDDDRRLPAIQEAVTHLSGSQRKLLIDGMRNDDLIRNYRYLYDVSGQPVERPRENEEVLLDQEGHVLYNSEQATRYIVRTLTHMKLGDAVGGLPLRMIPQWMPGVEETHELRGFGVEELAEHLEQRIPCLGGAPLRNYVCRHLVTRHFSYWCPECTLQPIPEPLRLNTCLLYTS